MKKILKIVLPHDLQKVIASWVILSERKWEDLRNISWMNSHENSRLDTVFWDGLIVSPENETTEHKTDINIINVSEDVNFITNENQSSKDNMDRNEWVRKNIENLEKV